MSTHKYACECGSTRYYENVTIHREQIWEVDADGNILQMLDEGEDDGEQVTGVICAGCNKLLKTQEENTGGKSK